ncbi:hypothetical protein [Dyadobacter bucti]|uniref:hypothetical protein n=1 Tax=Dyadobacter bucti TaxID=2572203 RepID=UPI001108A059|nr:hypothetical protein [Dyadobacter bucti]
MSPTIIGIFETAEEALEAKEALVNSGFDINTIEVGFHVDNQDRGPYTDGQVTDTGEHDNHLYLKFSGDDEYADRTGGTKRQGSLVTVHTSSPEDAARVADILGDYGALDVNEFSEGNQSDQNQKPI